MDCSWPCGVPKPRDPPTVLWFNLSMIFVVRVVSTSFLTTPNTWGRLRTNGEMYWKSLIQTLEELSLAGHCNRQHHQKATTTMVPPTPLSTALRGWSKFQLLLLLDQNIHGGAISRKSWNLDQVLGKRQHQTKQGPNGGSSDHSSAVQK